LDTLGPPTRHIRHPKKRNPGRRIAAPGLHWEGMGSPGSALIPETLPEYVVGRNGVDVIRRKPGEQITPHSNLSHAAGPSSHANHTDAD